MSFTSTWTPAEDAELARLRALGYGTKRAARAMGKSFGRIAGRARYLNLHSPPLRGHGLPENHHAVVMGRTLFPGSVQDPADAPRLLKPGAYSYKLGHRVTKGAWRGMPIFSLTLEERATCPRSCAVWSWCYGNTSPLRARIGHGPAMEARLARELAALQALHPRGFIVRLHMLGDFYSTEYVALWALWLRQFPALRVFGYTAWPASTPIGGAVAWLARGNFARFAIRLSSRHVAARHTVVVDSVREAVRRGAIVCPAQTGATRACSTCALCWSPAARGRTNAFLRHGMIGGRIKDG